ncbi:MAG: ornithine carbamoyltransferase [Candidatus Omnitrophica bacterium]|nr:ornithine carbamoyltransferase [Candidatus Omnitrophota bacterium]
MKKDLISINDLSVQEIRDIFALTDKLKKDKAKFSNVLTGKTLALIFQKPSNRTRVSFEVGMYQLGGNSIYLAPQEINLGVRESIEDVAKTLSRYVDAIVLRTYKHEDIIEMAKYSRIPVINGLSDFEHPCQALADVYTLKERCKSLKDITLAYVGDGNNVCNSLVSVCFKLGIKMRVACPLGYEPRVKVGLNLFYQPKEAVEDVDIIYTDVWTSMGQEKEAQKRRKDFKDFQVNKELVSLAKKDVLIMHCLPAHRGEEITDEIINSKNSIVFDQAENRMHVQKAILIKLLKNKA